MPSDYSRDAQWAFSAYEAVRHRLPNATFPTTSRKVANLGDLADHFDVFLLDAFGVLNVGEQAIPGAPERVAELQRAGKIVMVVSNAGSYPKRVSLERYVQFGYNIARANILTSREVLLAALSSRPSRKSGLMAAQRYGREELEHLDTEFLGEDGDLYYAVEEFLLIGSSEWTENRQSLLEASLRANPRPVLVGNPDIVAPLSDRLSRQPGHYAHRLADATGVVPEFFGKPFANIFDMALSRVPHGIAPARIVMVGDTLQTDILGGRVAGIKTALVTDFGSLKGIDVSVAIEQSGIVPDFILPCP
ncbi:MAG: HAD-IIA family hydrolase [Paracoccaceae bacterium]